MRWALSALVSGLAVVGALMFALKPTPHRPLTLAQAALVAKENALNAARDALVACASYTSAVEWGAVEQSPRASKECADLIGESDLGVPLEVTAPKERIKL